MNRVRVCRIVQLPDPVRISRYKKAPELGPRVLFFTGGSALNDLSRILKTYTHNSTHMVTPFDSGGSSAKLRKAFNMPAIGDLRSRLIALADESVTGQPEVYRLFAYRLKAHAASGKLLRRLDAMIAGRDKLVDAIPNPMRRLVRNQLGYFRDAMPADFDLRGASIGNLILAGGYLNNHLHLDPIIFLFEKLVGVRGTVRAIVNDDLHIGADLCGGQRIIGQHRLTGKEVAPLQAPIKKLFLSAGADAYQPVSSQMRKKNRRLIEKAELICYPPGSFYTSLIANLLPAGVGKAIAQNDGAKVFIPNLGQDPEQIGMSIDQSISTLLAYLRADVGKSCPVDKLLHFILLDSRHGRYPSALSLGLMRHLGIQVIDTPLVSKRSAPYYDAELLVAALLSLT
jgi:CofD-related protein of GAK system